MLWEASRWYLELPLWSHLVLCDACEHSNMCLNPEGSSQCLPYVVTVRPTPLFQGQPSGHLQPNKALCHERQGKANCCQSCLMVGESLRCCRSGGYPACRPAVPVARTNRLCCGCRRLEVPSRWHQQEIWGSAEQVYGKRV